MLRLGGPRHILSRHNLVCSSCITSAMSKLHNFLVERAKFPFLPLDGHLSSSITDISIFKVDLLETEWKAKVAVRDDTLVQKLCDALEVILRDAPLGEGAENYLLASFSPRIQVDELGREDMDWSTKSNERHVSFSGCPSFEAEQFRAGPGGRLGGCYTRGSFLPQANVFGNTIYLSVVQLLNIRPKKGALLLTTLYW